MLAGFTPGYHWLLIFQNSGREVSPSENLLASYLASFAMFRAERHFAVVFV